jgi:hypothetical protein
MSNAPEILSIFIPLTIRKRNGRPKIMPPAHMVQDTDSVDPHILKAVAKAWSWRQKLGSGQVGTMSDIAALEGVTHSYVGRMLRLAYLSPAILERLLVERVAPLVSLKDLVEIAELPWVEQDRAVFGEVFGEVFSEVAAPSTAHN